MRTSSPTNRPVLLSKYPTTIVFAVWSPMSITSTTPAINRPTSTVTNMGRAPRIRSVTVGLR